VLLLLCPWLRLLTRLLPRLLPRLLLRRLLRLLLGMWMGRRPGKAQLGSAESALSRRRDIGEFSLWVASHTGQLPFQATKCGIH
jgi:hypothetical protein